jgi:hypothetical protein
VHRIPRTLCARALALFAVTSLTLPTSALAAAAASPTYAVVGPTQKILPTDPVSGASSASITGGRNEFVSFQVVISGGSSGVGSATVTPGSLLSGPGGTIPAEKMTIYREAYYNVTQPSAGSRPTGQWPDALIPSVDPLYHEQRHAFPVPVPAGQNRVAFVDVLVPAAQAPGGYDGSVTLTTDGESVSIPVHLEVRNLTLPATSSLRSLFKINWITPCQALHPGCGFSQEQLAWSTNYDFARLALDDRISVADPQFQPPVNSTETNYFNHYMLPLINGTAGTQLDGN